MLEGIIKFCPLPWVKCNEAVLTSLSSSLALPYLQDGLARKLASSMKNGAGDWKNTEHKIPGEVTSLQMISSSRSA